MTSLKGRLTLELLKRKSSRKGLSQGFTLVELMIVIVIVGVLSAVALPSFLSQQNKAKLTESTSKVSAILKSAHAEYQMDSDEDDAINGGLAAAAQANNAGKFFYGIFDTAGTELTASTAGVDLFVSTDGNNDPVLIIGADPQGGNNADGAVTVPDTDNALVTAASTGSLAGLRGRVYGCINLNTGKIDVDREFKATIDGNLNSTGTTVTVAGLDCVR